MEDMQKNIKLLAVGDILLSDGFFNVGYGIGSQIEKKGDLYPFEKILPTLSGSDLLVGNLECPIAAKSPRTGLRAKEFLSSPSVVSGLKQAGFDVLSVANNHTLQHGAEVFRETVQHLNDAAIHPVGCLMDQAKRQKLITIERQGQSIGFLSYSLTEDEHNAVIKEYAYSADGQEIMEDINKFRNKCDQLILLLHWGDEFVSCPSADQVDLAHSLIDAGADIIIGHHPHVLQGIESYKGKTIAYSLGNFIFDMTPTFCCQSAILQVNIQNDGTQEAKLHPVWINDKFQPQSADNENLKSIKDLITSNNEQLSMPLLGRSNYNELVKSSLCLYRKSMHRNFIKNIYRLNPVWLLQMLIEFGSRRLRN